MPGKSDYLENRILDHILGADIKETLENIVYSPLVLQRDFILQRDFGHYNEILRFTLIGEP